MTLEFPGRHYDQDQKDISIVTYSSINTNRWEPYGETVFGSRGTLVMKTESDALLYKEASATSGGGVEQRLWVINSAGEGGGPVLDSYNTTAPSAAAGAAKAGMGEKISRGYREEMEHFCYCIRTGRNELRCPAKLRWLTRSWR